ncbi:hypothetical protein M433DRAFT_154901 [Acidomyces richmondensis BFW]|nr:MAG: hypothetical protein FE78DRAFT_91294 [Acidomyces sp. 'richmondensis']KYG45078.1 hypothetical protein M433DRAFT_154901 [Acidomyces richmondensis BFW]
MERRCMTSSHATLACITALPSRLSLELLASWCYSLWNSSKVHLQAHPSEEARIEYVATDSLETSPIDPSTGAPAHELGLALPPPRSKVLLERAFDVLNTLSPRNSGCR